MIPAYRWPGQPPPPTRLRARVGHQLVVGLALLTLALLAGLLRSPRGWLAWALAWLLVGMLAARRPTGRGERVRAAMDYAILGAFALMLVTAVPAAPSVKVPARPRPPVKVEAAQGDRLAEARARLAELRERLPQIQVSVSTKGTR
jgi:hypothetical protein